MIIDNQVYSFAFHLENGIPIIPFEGDMEDTELLRIMRYLDWISNNGDLRKLNDFNLKLKRIYNSGIEKFINYYLLDEDEYIEEDSDSPTFFL